MVTGKVVLVCGGRDYSDYRYLFGVLDRINMESGIACIVHGSVPGADMFADHWAAQRLVPCWRFPARWDKYGKAAGPIRNKAMLETAKPDMVVAFPGGAGTRNMCQIAMEAGVDVRRAGPSRNDEE